MIVVATRDWVKGFVTYFDIQRDKSPMRKATRAGRCDVITLKYCISSFIRFPWNLWHNINPFYVHLDIGRPLKLFWQELISWSKPVHVDDFSEELHLITLIILYSWSLSEAVIARRKLFLTRSTTGLNSEFFLLQYVEEKELWIGKTLNCHIKFKESNLPTYIYIYIYIYILVICHLYNRNKYKHWEFSI